MVTTIKNGYFNLNRLFQSNPVMLTKTGYSNQILVGWELCIVVGGLLLSSLYLAVVGEQGQRTDQPPPHQPLPSTQCPPVRSCFYEPLCPQALTVLQLYSQIHLCTAEKLIKYSFFHIGFVFNIDTWFYISGPLVYHSKSVGGLDSWINPWYLYQMVI